MTGYVLIAANAIRTLGLNNLRIVRGESLLSASAGEAQNSTGYSLYVGLNYRSGSLSDGGLLELQLTSLRGESKPSRSGQRNLFRADFSILVPQV